MNSVADVIVLGGGASGLMVSQSLGSSGLKVICFEKNAKAGRKILVSGGGRCNYTNLNSTHENFISSTRRFCHSALHGFNARDAQDWFSSIGVFHTEKKKGQLFCRDGAVKFLRQLSEQVSSVDVELLTGVEVSAVRDADNSFEISCGEKKWWSKNLIVATGGLSWPQLGVSDLGYRIATQYGHEVTGLSPGLVPLRLKRDSVWNPELKGIALPVKVKIDRRTIYDDDLLMTHLGISGPAVLQISSHLVGDKDLEIDLLPRYDAEAWIREKKNEGYKHEMGSLLKEVWPARLASSFAKNYQQQQVSQMKKDELQHIGKSINAWRPTILGNQGYEKAEVTLGGVSCDEVSSKTMESKRRRGLYFIGEVMDVTGELGGYNFQWAWSSAMACSRGIQSRLSP